MSIIVVTDDGDAPVGRRLVHAISMQNLHTASLWTVTRYKDNEATLEGKQPVIFLGDNELANSLVGALPERFRGHGTRCFYEGSKAVLVADTPSSVSDDELGILVRAVEANLDELRRSYSSSTGVAAATAGGLVAAGVGVAVTAAAGGVMGASATVPLLWPIVLGVGATFLLSRHLRGRKRRRVYRECQLEYAYSRFLNDELAGFVEGIEGIR